MFLFFFFFLFFFAAQNVGIQIFRFINVSTTSHVRWDTIFYLLIEQFLFRFQRNNFFHFSTSLTLKFQCALLAVNNGMTAQHAMVKNKIMS